MRQSQICGAGWLLFLFGVRSRKGFGRAVLKSLPNSHLANVSRWSLQREVDDVLDALKTARELEIKEIVAGDSSDDCERIVERIQYLINMRASDRARVVLVQNETELGDRFEPIQEKLNRFENGDPIPQCGGWLVGRRSEYSENIRGSKYASEALWRTENQKIVDILYVKGADSTADLDTLLSKVSTDPMRALSLLGFLNDGLDTSYKEKLVALALNLPPMARFVMFSYWNWVNGKLLVTAFDEAIATGQTYNVEASLLRAMSGQLSVPRKNSEKRKLFAKLSQLATGRAALGNDPLIDSAASQGVRAVGPEAMPTVLAADRSYSSSPKAMAKRCRACANRPCKSLVGTGIKKHQRNGDFLPSRSKPYPRFTTLTGCFGANGENGSNDCDDCA